MRRAACREFGHGYDSTLVKVDGAMVQNVHRTILTVLLTVQKVDGSVVQNLYFYHFFISAGNLSAQLRVVLA